MDTRTHVDETVHDFHAVRKVAFAERARGLLDQVHTFDVKRVRGIMRRMRLST